MSFMQAAADRQITEVQYVFQRFNTEITNFALEPLLTAKIMNLNLPVSRQNSYFTS